MRFAFSEDQLAFRSTVRDLLEKEWTPADVRAAWTSDTGRSPELWARLAEVGVVGLTVPEAQGGLGLGEVELVLLLEESGYAAVAEPLAETTAVGVPLLRDVEAGEEWLTKVATGNAVLAVGLSRSRYVSGADTADLLLLQHGEAEVHGVPPDQVKLDRQPSVDGGRRLFAVTWTPSSGTLLAAADVTRPALAAAFDRGALAASAQLLGVAARQIELAGTYAAERQQFGKPIGSFQAVKHHLANALLKLEFARPVVYRAAWTVATGASAAERARDVSMAKCYASDAALLASRVALQVHGAIGYTWEHDLHFWMKRATALAAAWGDIPWHRARVADYILDG